MLSPDLIDSLFPQGLPGPDEWERRYPPRELPAGAEVTRFSPSPTGYLHIGGVYVAIIDADIALHSGGTYLLRIEDTDQARVTEGAVDQFADALAYFSISPQEDDLSGQLRPVRPVQPPGDLPDLRARDCSARARRTCASRPRRNWRTSAPASARPARCPATTGRGRSGGTPPRSRSANGSRPVTRTWSGSARRAPRPGSRYTDAIRGEITADDNRNDAVILKSSDQPLRLPTYHFAHAVDDHLMRVSLVIRGDEWISSVPLHHQLFDALGFPRVRYAHIAPLMKQDGGSRRKLSKRRDPEASVGFYIEQGYPAEAVEYYLRGLANGRLAEVPLPEALATPISLDDFGAAGPLVDLVKLDDISADYIATLPAAGILARVITWAQAYDPPLAEVLAAEPDLALGALAIEREGVPNPRKDLRRWADFRAVYGYFFPEIFEPVTDAADPRFGGLDPGIVRSVAEDFAEGYQPPAPDIEWFGQIRDLAARLGFAPNQKAYKQDPESYRGSIRDASQVIRVLLTGTTRSPDLAAVAGVLGADEVVRRVRAVVGPPA